MNGATDREWWTKISGERPVPMWRVQRDAHIRELEIEYHSSHHTDHAAPGAPNGPTELQL